MAQAKEVCLRMVHIQSEGVFDAPVDKVWKLIEEHNDAKKLAKVHPSFLNAKVIEETGKVVVKEFTVKEPSGGTHTEQVRFTVDAPRATTMEWLTGPMKGSRCTNTYTAEGQRTKVVTEGDFTIQGMDEPSTVKMVNGFLDQSFDEDNRALQTMQ